MGSYFVYERRARWERSQTAKTLRVCQPGEVVALEIRRQGTPDLIRLEREENGSDWSLIRPALGEADPLYVQRVVSGFCEFTSAWEVFKPSDETHESDVRLDFFDAKKELISSYRFGKTLPGSFIEVAIRQGKELLPVHAVNGNFARLLEVPADRIRNRRVMRSRMDMVDLVKVDYGRGREILLERQGPEWKIKEKHGSVLGPSEPEKFVNRIGTLQAIEVLEEEAKDGECDALKPEVQVTLESISGEPEVLRFARRPEADKRPGNIGVTACSNRRRALFGVHNDLWKYILPKGQGL